MFCIKCGKQLVEGGAFCAFCGAKIASVSAQSVAFKQSDIYSSSNHIQQEIYDQSERVQEYITLALSAYDDKKWEDVDSYCNKALEIDHKNSKAWWLKGAASLNSAPLDNPFGKQCEICFSKSLEYSPNSQDEIRRLIVSELRRVSKKVIELYCVRFIDNPSEKSKKTINDMVMYCLTKLADIIGKGTIDYKVYGSTLLEALDNIARQTWEHIPRSIDFTTNESASEKLGTIFSKMNCCATILQTASMLEMAFNDIKDCEANVPRYRNMIMILTAVASIGVTKSKNSWLGKSQQKIYYCDEEFRDFLVGEIINLHNKIQAITPSYEIPSEALVRKTIM